MTTYRRNYASERAGFTLVEILVVIVIIGLLAGMTTTVVVSARRSVNASVVSSQEAQLSIALDEYKNRYGEYPPDFSDKEAVVRHVKKRWPRFNIGTGTTDVLYSNFVEMVGYGCRLSSGGYKSGDAALTNLDKLVGTHLWQLRNYASSLVFWLGGLPNEQGVPSGFYASPKYPLGIDFSAKEAIARPERAKREKPLFLFDKKTVGALGYVESGEFYYVNENPLNTETGVREYVPAFIQGGYPVLYFRPSVGSPYGNKGFTFGDSANAETTSCAVPYARTGTKRDDGSYASLEWYEETRFQLVHPGADGLYGDDTVAVRVLQPKNGAVTGADDDNVTNFIDSGTLVSEYETSN